MAVVPVVEGCKNRMVILREDITSVNSAACTLYGLEESDLKDSQNCKTDLNMDLRSIGCRISEYPNGDIAANPTSMCRASKFIPILEKHGYEFHHASTMQSEFGNETVIVVWEFMKKV